MSISALDPDLLRYVLDQSTPLGTALERLVAENREHPRSGLQLAVEAALLLRLLTGLVAADRALEIGTFTGLSSTAIAQALPPGGRLVCLDLSEEWTARAQQTWSEAGVDDRIELRLGDAHESLAAMNPDETFDLAFVDADKEGYVDYYEAVLPRMSPGGIMAFDNTLASGKVVDASGDDGMAAAIHAFNRHVANDPRVETVLLPIGDGLTLLRPL